MPVCVFEKSTSISAVKKSSAGSFGVPLSLQEPMLAKEKTSHAATGMDHFLDRTLGILGDAYLVAREDIITQEQEAIRELSTPVLKLREGMPPTSSRRAKRPG